MQRALAPGFPLDLAAQPSGSSSLTHLPGSRRRQLQGIPEQLKGGQMGVSTQPPVPHPAVQDFGSANSVGLLEGRSMFQRDPKLQRYATNPTPQARTIPPAISPLARNTTTHNPSSRVSSGTGLTSRHKRVHSKPQAERGQVDSVVLAINLPERKSPDSSGSNVVRCSPSTVSVTLDPGQISAPVPPGGMLLLESSKCTDASSDPALPSPAPPLRCSADNQPFKGSDVRLNIGQARASVSTGPTETSHTQPVPELGTQISTPKEQGTGGEPTKASPQRMSQKFHIATSQTTTPSSAAEWAKSPHPLTPVAGRSQHHRRRQGNLQQQIHGRKDQLPSGLRRTGPMHRPPRRRAVVVGVNYIFAPDIRLHGCCNDATLTALSLINLCDFQPHDVILLVDAFPSACYRSPHFEEREDEGPDEVVLWKDRQPTRRNILLALNWLRSETQPGDVLFFFFAGHGVQLDDMSGWEGEGYDEAILPMDFFGDEVNALTAVMIKNLLLSVSDDVQLTIVLDCAGGQTMLDPAGTGTWKFIKGVKQKGVWPLVTDATDKVARAVYDPITWTCDGMKRRGARPRFVPGVDVSSTQDLLDPTLQRPTNQRSMNVKGFLFASAPWGQTAIEAKMPAIALRPVTCRGDILRDRPVTMMQGKRFAYHGVFSWCFLTALRDLIMKAAPKRSKGISYQRLLWEIEMKMNHCKSKEGGLLKLNQTPELTFYRAGTSDVNDLFLWPFGGKRRGASFSTEGGSASMLPCVPHETRYLSPWEAEEELALMAQRRRERDPALRAQIRRCQENLGNPWKASQPSPLEHGLVFGSKHQSVQHSTTSPHHPSSSAIPKVTQFFHSSFPLNLAGRDTLTPKQFFSGTEKQMSALIPQIIG